MKRSRLWLLLTLIASGLLLSAAKRKRHARPVTTNNEIEPPPEQQPRTCWDNHAYDKPDVPNRPVANSPHDSYNSPDRAAEAENKEQQRQSYSRWTKVCRGFRRQSPTVQASATFVIMLATIGYAIYAGLQWSTLQQQLTDFEATERAAIIIGVIEFNSRDGILHLPYENSGRVSATLIEGQILEGRTRNGDTIECSAIPMPPGSSSEIASGTGHISSNIDLPDWSAIDESALLNGTENILFDLSLTYDDGFRHVRSLKSCWISQWQAKLKNIA